MADLAYDTTSLGGLASNLATITDDLKHDKALKEFNETEVASNRVAEAIDDFVNDWDDKRNQLVKKVEALAVMAQESLEKLSEADRDLASMLREGATKESA